MRTASSADRRVPVDLRLHSRNGYHPGRPFAVRALWVVVEALVLLNPVVTSYALKRFVLRLFGAKLGRDVLIKPGVHVKHPWRLVVGDSSWLGERAWIDNLVEVRIGDNVCISQGAYLCTGNHDWSQPGMPMTPRPIVVEDGAWVGAFARVAPGTTVRRGAVLALGAVLLHDAEADTVYTGNPAAPAAERTLRVPVEVREGGAHG